MTAARCCVSAVAYSAVSLSALRADLVRHRVVGESCDLVQPLADFGKPNGQALRVRHRCHLRRARIDSATNVTPPPPSRKRPPAVPFRVRAPILPRGFFEMAPPAKGLQVLGIVGRPATVQRPDVIAFEPTRPAAQSAPVAIAAEHQPPKPRPSAPVELGVKPGAASGHYPASPW